MMILPGIGLIQIYRMLGISHDCRYSQSVTIVIKLNLQNHYHVLIAGYFKRNSCQQSREEDIRVDTSCWATETWAGNVKIMNDKIIVQLYRNASRPLAIIIWTATSQKLIQCEDNMTNTTYKDHFMPKEILESHCIKPQCCCAVFYRQRREHWQQLWRIY